MSEEAYASGGRGLVGRVIEGRYRIVRKIADGGMATVFEAVDERLSRHVALKLMHMQLVQGSYREQFIERFHREARSAASIASPHIVQVYDTGTYEGMSFLVMEYVHGVNLRHEMNQQGNFSVRETLRILSQTLDGLSSAHQAQVIHRDVKPENILINDRGHVQLTDFGLARVASQATLSTTGMLLGTAAYLAPEMIESNSATKQGDVYASGIIAYEMLTGSVPFIADNPVTVIFKHVHSDIPSLTSVCPGIDPSVAAFIARLTSRHVEDRPADAQQAFEELENLSKHLTLEAKQFRMPPDAAHRHTTTAHPLSASAELLDPPVPQSQATSRLPLNPNPQIDTRMDTQLDAHTNRMPISPSTSDESQPHDADQSSQSSAQSVSMMGLANSNADLSTSNAQTTALQTQHPRRVPVMIAIGLLLVIAASAGSAWWYFLGPGSYQTLPQPSDISCESDSACSVNGASWAAYSEMLSKAGIQHSQTEAYSDSVPQGSIISAHPSDVGSHISKRGGTASFIISKGVKQATIPEDILDATSAHGKKPLAALKSAGFTNIKHDETSDEYSSTVPENSLISINPEPGTTLNHNASIQITLSKGPKPVSMPNIVGIAKKSAQEQLDEAQLHVNFKEDWSDTVQQGSVISSDQPAGAQLHWGDSVSVVISKGPQMVTLPDVRGKNEDEARKILKALGLDVKISAPLGDITQTVRLQSPDPGSSIRLRDTSGKATVITLTVV